METPVFDRVEGDSRQQTKISQTKNTDLLPSVLQLGF
jgi:hypothetical protein